MNLTKALIIPLVGAHFRPPAKALISSLRAGSPLTVVPEPENIHDADAVAVYVDVHDVHLDEGRLTVNLVGTGYMVPDVTLQRWWQLGYLAKSGAKTANGGPGNLEGAALQASGQMFHTRLGFSPEGNPTVEFITESVNEGTSQ